MPTVRVSRYGDCQELAPRLRKADREELQACGVTPLHGLLKGFFSSRYCYSGLDDDGKVICMFGVVDGQDDNTGWIWLLGSDDIPKISKTFLRETRRYLKLFQEQYPLLTNQVDARNVVHIGWLKWCGFKFINRIEDFGPEHRPFYEFVRIQNNV